MDITSKIGIGILVVGLVIYMIALFISHGRMKKLAKQLGVNYNPFQYLFFFSRLFQVKGDYRGHQIHIYSLNGLGLPVQILVDGKNINVLKSIVGGVSRTPLSPEEIKNEIDKYIDQLKRPQ